MFDRKSFLNRLLNVVWLTVLVIVGVYIYEYLHSVTGKIDEIDYLYISISIVTGVIFTLPAAWILMDYFDGFNIRHSLPVAIFLVFVPALGKYIPGKIWALGSFVLYGKSIVNISAENALVFQIYFQLMSVVSTILLLLAGYVLGYKSMYSVEFLLITVIIILALFVIVTMLKKRVQNTGLKINTEKSFNHLLAFTLQKILRGISLVIFISAFIDIGDHWVVILFSFFAAMQVGVLAFFAPAGLGVTEGAYILILSPVLGPEIAVLVAIISRAWLTALDFILAACGLACKRYYIEKFDKPA